MRTLRWDIVKTAVVLIIVNLINKWIGGVMIQSFFISFWHRYPFEITTSVIALFVLGGIEYYRIFCLGVKAFEREWDGFRTKTENDIEHLKDLMTKLRPSERK